MSLPTTTSTTLTLPHPVLTPIPSEPTNTKLQLFRQELYANARAVHSTRGGGTNGHLALLMTPEAYLARTGHVFVAPIHPGDSPNHGPQPTASQITETNRQFAADLAEHTRYMTVAEEFKRLINNAVAPTYLRTLADDEFGYADVTCCAMLTHLQTTYGVITHDELEINRNLLSADWNPDNPMEDLWNRIHEVQRFAEAGNDPIPDTTAVRLTLPVLEKTGVFSLATEDWRKKDDAEWTLENFKTLFTKANKERRRKLTAQSAGFHGAHAANAATTATVPPTDTATAYSMKSDGCTMYYCWSHGLGKNRSHTSLTCNRKGEGHKDNATVTNMMGGCNTIMRGRPTRPDSGN